MDAKVFLNKKKAVKSSLTRLKNKTLDDVTKLDCSELNVRRVRFNSIGEELKEIFGNLFSVIKDEEIEQYSDEKEELLESLDEMFVLIDRQILKLTDKVGNNKDKKCNSSTSDLGEIKLPTLSLPTFSGIIEEWLTFSDLFQAAVTKNLNLTGAQKLQYLKGVLKGDAQKVVQSLSITDGNFKIAWDLLNERYFHKREILSSLVKKFLNISPVTSESHSQILNLVDSAKEYVRLLETLDLKVEGTADIVLMFIIQFKLDSATRGWWERSLDNEKIPSLNELLSFLSNHARSLINSNQYVKRNIGNKRVTLVASGFQYQCVYCRGNHNLWKCDAFCNQSVQKRVSFVKSNNICFNCLTQFHQKSTCKSTNKCRKCGLKSHHTLLHYDREKVMTNAIPVVEKTRAPAVVYSTRDNVASCEPSNVNIEVNSCFSRTKNYNFGILATALIYVRDVSGEFQLLRALIDVGSTSNFISERAIQLLGLKRNHASLQIKSLGSNVSQSTRGVVELSFSQKHLKMSKL